MKRMPFERPTEYYDERIFQIDEQICSLLKQRKELSNQNPGFPPDKAISDWAKKYGFYTDYLNSLFSSMRDENYFKPHVEPTTFKRLLPVFKTFEHKEKIYTITFIRQYSNASVIYLYIDWDSTNEILNNRHMSSFFELSINDTYDCRAEGGGGTDGHMSFNFVVSPPLPDNPSGISLLFKEYNMPFADKPASLEFAIEID